MKIVPNPSVPVAFVALVLSANAAAQQAPIPGDFPECNKARELYLQRRFAEATPWQRICYAKRTARPQQARPAAPQLAPAPAPSPTAEPSSYPRLHPGPEMAAMERLPSREEVEKAMGPADAKDRQDRLYSAFELLQNFLEFATGPHRGTMGTSQGMPPGVAARWNEYSVAKGEIFRHASPQGVLKLGLLGGSEEFRRQTLGRFVPESLVDAYELTSWGHQPRAKAPQIRTAADQATDETARSVRQEMAEAVRHGIDLGVFGIQLGEPLNLPSCSASSSSQDGLLAEAFLGSSVAETCVVKEAATLDQGIAQLTAAATAVPWATNGVPVKLASSKCPAWVKSPFGCVIIFNLQNNVPIGAMFQTNGLGYEEKIISALTHKYKNQRPASGGKTWCRNTLTGIVTDEAPERHWSLDGLYVSYLPIVSCNNNSAYGRVTVELKRLRKVRDQAEQRQEATEPKM